MSPYPVFTRAESFETKNFKVLLASTEKDKLEGATDVRVALKSDGEPTDYYINASGITKFTYEIDSRYLDYGILLSWNLPTYITFEPEKFPFMVALKKRINRSLTHEVPGLPTFPHLETVAGTVLACLELHNDYSPKERFNRLVAFESLAADGQSLELPNYIIGDDIRVEALEHVLKVLRRAKTEMNGAKKKDFAQRISNVGPYLAFPSVEYWDIDKLRELRSTFEERKEWDRFRTYNQVLHQLSPRDSY